MDGPDELLHAQFLTRRGVRADIEVRQTAPRIARIRRGVYADVQRWEHLQAAERYRMFVLATIACMRSTPTICGQSAAVLWGLPSIGRWPEVVEVVEVAVTSDGPGSTGLVMRRRTSVIPTPHDLDGIQVTSPARTVVDVARSADFAAALTGADAALRAGLCTHDELDREVQQIPQRAGGRRAAMNVAHLADGRLESPGESLSRARMWELGLPQPRLQVPLGDEQGHFGRADFGWDGVIGEFDGKLKYRAGELTDEPTEDVLWREKQREDRIRRYLRVVRWTWDDALRSHPLARILAGAGILPTQARPSWVRAPRHS